MPNSDLRNFMFATGIECSYPTIDNIKTRRDELDECGHYKNEIKRLGIVPILDLMHFGVPDWIGNFQNLELPYQFCRYAAAVVERYP